MPPRSSSRGTFHIHDRADALRNVIRASFQWQKALFGHRLKRGKGSADPALMRPSAGRPEQLLDPMNN